MLTGRGADLQGRRSECCCQCHAPTATQEKPELQHWSALGGTTACSTHLREKPLGMETEGLCMWSVFFLVCSQLTVILSCNAAGSSLFHPKSHMSPISFTSPYFRGNIKKWPYIRRIKRSQSGWTGLLCLMNLQRSSWVLFVTSCSIAQLGGSCCRKTSSSHI